MMDEADTDDLCNAVLAKDGEGCTPILWAAKKGYADVAEALLAAGSSGELGDASLPGQVVNSTDADGNTALHWAARSARGVANAPMSRAPTLTRRTPSSRRCSTGRPARTIEPYGC